MPPRAWKFPNSCTGSYYYYCYYYYCYSSTSSSSRSSGSRPRYLEVSELLLAHARVHMHVAHMHAAPLVVVL